MYSMSYQRGMSKRRRGPRWFWWVLIALLVLVGAYFAITTILDDGPKGTASPIPQPSIDKDKLQTQLNSGSNTDAARWSLVVQNKFGVTQIDDAEVCKELHNWYELRKRQYKGSGNPTDNQCTLYFNGELAVSFYITSDDSRVMVTEDKKTFMILSDILYDKLQREMIEKNASLLSTDEPGQLTAPNPEDSLGAFPPIKEPQGVGWQIVVQNELGAIRIRGIDKVCEDLYNYVNEGRKTDRDPGAFDNKIWLIRDGEEVMHLYASGGEILLTENQENQMFFPQEMVDVIEAELVKRNNSLYEGKRFGLSSASPAPGATIDPSASPSGAPTATPTATPSAMPTATAKRTPKP